MATLVGPRLTKLTTCPSEARPHTGGRRSFVHRPAGLRNASGKVGLASSRLTRWPGLAETTAC